MTLTSTNKFYHLEEAFMSKPTVCVCRECYGLVRDSVPAPAVQQGGPGLVLQHCPLLQPGQILRNSSHTVFTFPLVIRFWTITGSQSRVWTMMWSLSWLFFFLVSSFLIRI